MPIDTVAALIEALRQSRLLDPAQLSEVEQTLQPRCADARALARELLQRGWVTAFQVNQIMQGRAADLVLGQYVLLERLGEGGMGQVFKARHRMMNRTVAIKLIRNEVIAHPQAVRRFRQEIEAAAKLSHPNIVIAHDANEVDGKHFLTMEYVEGTDLSKLVKQQGPVAPDRACDYIRQAALGLQHACERGLVHRDIKPSNLLLAVPAGSQPGGTIKLVDMGLARLMSDNGSSGPTHELTKAGTLVGTADYMAPEQAVDSHQADIRADIYSLGCTLYYLLTAQPPFPHGTVMQKLFSHNQEEPQPLEQLRVDLPDGLGDVVRRMMAKGPQDRYQTPGAAAAALTPFCFAAPAAAGSSAPGLEPGAIQRFPALPQAVPVRPVPGSSLLVGAASGALDIQQPLPARRKGWLLMAGLALGIVILGGVAWALIGLRGGPRATEGVAQGTAKSPDAEKFTNSIGMKLVRIPAGKFWMGSPENEVARAPHESPLHEVVLSRPFYMGTHEVTVGQFRAFVKATNHKTEAERDGRGAARYDVAIDKFVLNPQFNWENPGWPQEDEFPVVCVNWNDARSFCAWLSEKEGRTYRLPTEAEWEYACRAGTTTPFSLGSSLSSFQANFNGNKPYGDGARGPDRKRLVKVGTFKPNAFGLYDMHGNAAEWTADLMGAYAAGTQTNPTGAAESDRRIARGGDWGHPGEVCRSAARMGAKPTFACNVIGFRVVCEP